MSNEKARELIEFRSKLTSLIGHGRLLVNVESLSEDDVAGYKEIANAVLAPGGIDVNGPENVGGDTPADDVALTVESLQKTAKAVDAAILKADQPSVSTESASRFADIFPAFVMPEKVETVDEKVDRAVGGFFPQWAESFRKQLQAIKDRRGDGLMPVATLESVMNETMLNTQAITRLNQDPEANAVRWIEVYKSIQGLKVVLRLLAKCPLDQLDGDEFSAIKKLIRNTIIRCGFYVDEVDYANTAVELDKVVDKALEIAHTRVQMHWQPGMPGALTE